MLVFCLIFDSDSSQELVILSEDSHTQNIISIVVSLRKKLGQTLEYGKMSKYRDSPQRVLKFRGWSNTDWAWLRSPWTLIFRAQIRLLLQGLNEMQYATLCIRFWDAPLILILFFQLIPYTLFRMPMYGAIFCRMLYLHTILYLCTPFMVSGRLAIFGEINSLTCSCQVLHEY